MTFDLSILIPCAETSRWRRALDYRFPMHSRNAYAADILDRIAEQLKEIEDSELHEIVERLCERKSPEKVHETISGILRSVGIGWAPSAHELVIRVIDELEGLDDDSTLEETADFEPEAYVALTNAVEHLANNPAMSLRTLVTKASLIAEWIGAEFEDPADLQDRAVFSVLKDLLAMRQGLDAPVS